MKKNKDKSTKSLLKNKNNDLYKKSPYLIAECAYSYEGKIDYLKKSIKKISRINGVSAIKFHILLNMDSYMCRDHELYKKVKKWTLTPKKWQQLINYSKKLGLEVIILADDLGSMSFLKSIENKLSAVEIHACSLNDIKMLNKISDFNIPVILGIGGSTIEEITFAINFLKKKGKTNIILMYGFQNFPTKYKYINFKKMQKIKKLFNLPVGYADHTSWDNEYQELITLTGFLMGAHIIEKHFVLEKGKKRIDYQSAISSKDFHSLYQKISVLQKAIGSGTTELNKYEKNYKKIGPMKKAIVANRNLEKNEKISLKNIAFKRTSQNSNIEQREIVNLLKRQVKNKIKKDKLITFENTY